jgi:NitT/TauT family transport system substrate-binding protein
MIRKFVQASAEGWKSYLKNPAPGNALIKKANPEMTEELMAFGVAKMKEYGLVTGGDAKTQGILSMTDNRWQQTFDFMVSAGLTPADVEYRKAYTLQFVKEIKVLP